MCIHFVGFIHPAQGKDTRLARALAVFGPAGFIHRRWDVRAAQEIAPGDVVVFADGSAADAPNAHAFDDSANV